jgi:hypothetical protein
MRRQVVAIVLAGSSVLAACAATSGAHDATPSGTPGAPAGGPNASNAWEGTLVPADATTIAVWPESYAGELVVLDVLTHGSRVKQGDVIAHLDLRAIDDQIRQAELEAHSALVRRSNAEEKDRIDREAATAALEQAKAALDRARRALEGWEKHELEFAHRAADLDDRHRVAGIEDQTDELAQLEKMYKADELIDATEEIVLKRSRRGLELSKTGLALARDRHDYQLKYDEALQGEAKREAVRVQEEALGRLERSQAVDRRAADDALERVRAQERDQTRKLEELRRDRELLTVHAPRAGVLLHGSPDDYRPKQAQPRHDRGTRLATRTRIFSVADPAAIAVAVDVSEAKRIEAKPGSRVEIQPLSEPSMSIAGKLQVDEYPEAKSAALPEASYEGRIQLDHGAPELRFGMRVRVKVVPGATDVPQATQSDAAHVNVGAPGS